MANRLIYNLPFYARAARRMKPANLAARLAARAGFGRLAGVRRAVLLSNPALLAPDRIARLFGLVETEARERLGWSGVDLEAKRVLEVGCGPLGGFAPIAVMRGASAYEGFDPSFDSDVFNHRAIREKYLEPTHRHLAATSRGAPDRATFLTRLDTDCEFTGAGIEARRGRSFADLVVSLSCLEHIAELDGALAALAAATGPDTRHLHLVNFSNHLSKDRPFHDLYDLHPDEHRRRFGAHINMLRPSELAAGFRGAGFSCRLVPVSVMPDALEGLAVHDWWAQRFPAGELAVRTALIAVEPREPAARR